MLRSIKPGQNVVQQAAAAPAEPDDVEPEWFSGVARPGRRTPAETRPTSGRPFALASLTGGTVGLVMFGALLTRGFHSVTSPAFSTNFFDLQAQAVLKGHLWIPDGSASLEGVEYHGHTYIYFGPFLALLHLPIVWLAPGTVGHLAQTSMLVGAAVLVAGASWLGWNVRVVLRGAVPLTRFEAVTQGAFCATLAGGSVALYLAGSPGVYYETELWGCALTVASLGFFMSYYLRRTMASALLLSLAALAVSLTRVSVAVGPTLLVLVALGSAVRRARTRPAGNPAAGPGQLLVLAVGAVCVVSIPCWINWLKFGSLVSVPWSHQVVALTTPTVADFYRNHGVFGFGYLPSTLGWYLRPWTLLTTGLFPFFSFTSHAAVTHGSHFLAVGRASSIPASMPLLTVLTIAGLIIVARSRVLGPDEDADDGADGRRALRLAVAAAAASGLAVLVFDTIANRYLADLLPLLVIASLITISWAARYWTGWPRPVHWAIGLAAAGLTVFSALVNLSLGLEEGLVFASSPTPAEKAGLVEWQLSIHQALPVALSFPASTGRQPPVHAVPGQLFVEDGCVGVYQYNGPIWNELEVGAAGGRRILDVHLPPATATTTGPLLVADSAEGPGSYQYFSVQYDPANRYRLLYESQPWDGFEGHQVVAESPWEQLPASRNLHLDLTIAGSSPDGARIALALVPGVLDFLPGIPVGPADNWTVGGFPDGGPTFSGQVKQDPVPTPLCAQVRKAIQADGL